MAFRWSEAFEDIQVIWEGSILFAPSHHFFADPYFLVRVSPFALPDS